MDPNIKETNQQSRLRLFLQEYEILCKKYSLVITSKGLNQEEMIYERFDKWRSDTLEGNLSLLQESGINE